MCKTEKTTIGDHEYSVTQWPATKAMVMKLKVAKYLGKALSVANKGGNIVKNLMGNLSELLEDVDEEKFVVLLKEVACAAIRDGERMKVAQFDMYFQGEIKEIYELAFFVLKVNYEDFLGSVLN